MKNLIIFLLLIPCVSFSQNKDNACDYISQYLKEKPLECIDKSKLQNNEEIYQFFKWSSFRQDYLIRVERKRDLKTLVVKKIFKSSYDQETGNYQPQRFEILKQRRLTNSEFGEFKHLLYKHGFWEKNDYHVKSLCSDGSGILVYALKKDYLTTMSNGNCSPGNEYLYYLYEQISEIFGL